MTGSRALVRVSFSTGRYLLPWLVVLLASVSLATVVMSAATSSWALHDAPDSSRTPESSEVRAMNAAADETARPRSRGSCSSYAGAYGWLLHDMVTRGRACEVAVLDKQTSSADH